MRGQEPRADDVPTLEAQRDSRPPEPPLILARGRSAPYPPGFPRKPATFPREDQKKRVERKYLRYAGVGVQFGLTIFLLTLLGTWLDGRFGTEPLFTIVLLLLGFVGGTWSLVRQVLDSNRK